jgi:D-alanyl-D-alanine carboxypeptidase/D-alanyl-D-alanine-endopeptidase (penicillin-binding protein 4)
MARASAAEEVRTLAGYADTSKHGQLRFVISLKSNDGAMRFLLLQAIESGLYSEDGPRLASRDVR